QVGVTVDDGIEKSAKLRDSFRSTCYLAIDDIEYTREKDHQRGPNEDSLRKQNHCEDIDHHADEREDVGMNVQARQQIDDKVDYALAGSADLARYGLWFLWRVIVRHASL